MSGPYDEAYFTRLHTSSLQSAREVVPLVLDLIAPRRIVDVGCGTGAWLSIFAEHGVTDICGIDGEYVGCRAQALAPGLFEQRDLSRPFRIDRRADLTVCLEVAEHLPPAASHGFIAAITAISPVVLFSAAIPGQGGTGHVNEQWPDYWAARFRAHDFVPLDCLRPQIWHNPRISVWFRQNILLYVREDFLAQSPRLQAEQAAAPRRPLAVVHPEMFLQKRRL